jgi:hypothetical protein
MGSVILAAVLAGAAMPAGCLAALGESPRGGVAPAPPAHLVEAAPASCAAAPGQAADVPVREARLMVAAAADELDALVSAARGAAPRGGPGGQAAFWSAAGALQRALADLDGALAAGDPASFLILGEAQRSLVAVQVALRRAGTWRERRAAETGTSGSAAGDETARRMTALAGTVGRLARALGREAVPAARPGDGLSAAQALQLQNMARAARAWRAALPALTAAARQQGDAALQSELAKLDALLRQVAAEQSLTFAAYLAAVSASNQALALWSANAAYLDPDEQQASQQGDAAAADLTTAADTGFVFSADLSGGTAWTYAEGPPGGDAAAVPGDGWPAGGGGPGDAGAAGAPGEGGGGPGDGPGELGAADSRFADVGAPSGDMDVRPGDLGGRSGEPGGDEWTGLPGEASAATAGAAATGAAGAEATGAAGAEATGAAGAEAAPGAPGAAAASGGSGWVVIHGGPDAGWEPDSSPPAAAAPRFALQLGDAQDEALAPEEWVTGAGDDDGSDASAPLDWEEICRPWQPAGRSVCPGPGPQLPGDVEP